MPETLQQHLHRLHVDGYTVLPSILNKAEIAQIKTELAPYLRGEKMGRNDFEGTHTERVYALLAKAPSIARLIEHPDTLPLIEALLPANFLLSAALAIYVHPGETPQPFHIDDGAGGLNIPMPRPRFGVSTIWAIDEFTADNGATEVIPGSHLWSVGQQPDPRDAISITMPAGSVVVFDGRLTHRGGANNANTTRLGITPQYCAPGLRQIENMPLAVPPHLARRYSSRLQSMLGYSIIEPGFMGYVDGMHPKRLIDAGYQGRKHRSDLPAS